MKQSTIFGEIMVEVGNSDKLILSRLRKPLTPNVSKSVTDIYSDAERVFTSVKTLLPHITHELVTEDQRLRDYLEVIKKTGVVALDTEVDGLNPKTDRIAGFSAYTEGENPIYVPINHEYSTNIADARWFFKELSLIPDLKIIMHNARYDLRVLYTYSGVMLTCYFDTMIASMLLNENEEHGLKALWSKYISGNNAEHFSYTDLFEGMKFTIFDPSKVFIYASLDSYMTYTLWQFQSPFLDPSNEACEEQDLLDTSKLFFNIEMPIVHIAVDMEERGIRVDLDLAKELDTRYNQQIFDAEKRIREILDSHMPLVRSRISQKQLMSLSNPINIGSSQQLAIILYDGLGLTYIDKRRNVSRSVDKDAIDYLTKHYPDHKELFELMTEQKGLTKILSTYIRALPAMVHPVTGRIHPNWKTIGTETGRFSSSTPNLQNIPSKNGDIRPMFIPKDGYVFVGCDYSSQEPRILAEVSQDPVLIDSFLSERDIYSTLSSMAYNLPYESCTKDTKEGKVRRNHGKVLQLALSYGMGVPSLAASLNMTKEEAKELYNKFTTNLKIAFEYGERQKAFCRLNGYVKTLWGRKRRFPDYTLPSYEIVAHDKELNHSLKVNIFKNLSHTWGDSRRELIAEIEQKYNITITDNTKKISDCATNILNAIIQGSAADMTKIAMILIYEDSLMREWDAQLVLSIHDEIIVECPEEYSQEVLERLSALMVEAASFKIKTVPFKAEGEVMNKWHKD